MTGVEPHVLRYWETKFKELSPGKNRGGKRIYSDKDIEVIYELKRLIKDDQFSTAGAQKALNGTPADSKPALSAEIKRDLGEIRTFLLKLSEKL